MEQPLLVIGDVVVTRLVFFWSLVATICLEVAALYTGKRLRHHCEVAKRLKRKGPKPLPRDILVLAVWGISTVVVFLAATLSGTDDPLLAIPVTISVLAILARVYECGLRTGEWMAWNTEKLETFVPVPLIGRPARHPIIGDPDRWQIEFQRLRKRLGLPDPEQCGVPFPAIDESFDFTDALGIWADRVHRELERVDRTRTVFEVTGIEIDTSPPASPNKEEPR